MFHINFVQKKLLNKQEEKELFEASLAGNESAREKLVMHNMKLVLKIVNSLCLDTDLKEELFQQGCIGLLKAVDRYDLSSGNRFSTYATFWVRQSIFDYLKKTSQVYYPINLAQELSNYKTAIKRGLTDKEVCHKYNWKKSKLEKVKTLVSTSFVEVDSPNEKGLLFELEDSCDPGVIVEEQELSTKVKQSLQCLNDRERAVVIEKYYPYDSAEISFKSIGANLGISQQLAARVSQKAITKLQAECC